LGFVRCYDERRTIPKPVTHTRSTIAEKNHHRDQYSDWIERNFGGSAKGRAF
jgi:hypothetical protein